MKLASIFTILLALLSTPAFAARICEPMKGFQEPGQNERFDGGFVHFGRSTTHEWAFYLCHPRRLDADTARVVYIIAPIGTVSPARQAALYASLTKASNLPDVLDAYWLTHVTMPMSTASLAAALPAMKADVRLQTGFDMK